MVLKLLKIKDILKNNFIIILSILILIIGLIDIFSNKSKEGFGLYKLISDFNKEVDSSHDDYNQNLKNKYSYVDRVKDSTDSSKFYYCIGGDVSCNYGSTINSTIEPSYKDGKTFDSSCNDSTKPICLGSIFYNNADYNFVLCFNIILASKSCYKYKSS